MEQFLTEESHKKVREPAVETLKDEDLFVVDKVRWCYGYTAAEHSLLLSLLQLQTYSIIVTKLLALSHLLATVSVSWGTVEHTSQHSLLHATAAAPGCMA